MFEPFEIDVTDILEGIPPLTLLDLVVERVERGDEFAPSAEVAVALQDLRSARGWLAQAYRQQEREEDCE